MRSKVHPIFPISLVGLLCALPSQWAVAQQSAPAGNPLDVLPRVAPAAPSAKPQLEAPPPQSQDVLAQVVVPKQFDIVGVKSVPFDAVAKLFVPLAGQPVTVARIVEVANQVTALYRDAGYALSFAFVQPQDFQNGVVKVTIVEGHIGQLVIEGDAGKSEARLRELAAPLLAERPLRTATFERQSQLMARLPGIRTAASAQLPTTVDGASTLKLVTKFQPITVGLGGELRQPTSRFVASANVNDLLWGGSQLQVAALLRQLDTERFFSIAHTQLLNAQGTVLRVSASNYRSLDDVNLATQGFNDLTRQRRVDLTVQHPWRLAANETGFVAGGLYGVNYGRRYQFPANGAEVNDEERIRVLMGQFSWNKASAQYNRSAAVTLAHGLNAFGARTQRSNNVNLPMAANPARLSFTRLSFDVAERRRFTTSGWGGALSFGGQLTGDRLPTPERISFGGSRYARGYQPGAVTGDRGLGLGLELHKRFTTASSAISQWEPYLLYEVARTWQRQAGELDSRLRSATVGLRFAGGRSYSADLGVSKPLGDRMVDNPNRRLRVSLMLSYQLD